MKKLNFLLLLIGVLFGPMSIAAAPPTVSLETLLREMTNRETIARWPDPAYTCRQFSSYDRASVTPEDKRGWFGNFDQGQFIRQETHEGRTEYVMMDAEGPGAIVRFWMTFSGVNRGQGTLRIYVDDYDKPVVEGNVRDILSGHLLCGAPLSTSVPDAAPAEERGHNLYLPIPYAERCKVTIESPDLKITPEGKIESTTIVYYAINYRTYTTPVEVVSFSTKELKKNARLIEKTNQILAAASPAIEAPVVAGDSTLYLTATLAPGESRSFTIRGTRAINRLAMRIDAAERQQALRSTVLSIAFDGEQTVWAPVGDFFGVGYQSVATGTWYTRAVRDDVMSACWIMPFEKSCTVTLTNYGSQPVKISKASVVHGPWQWDDRSMHFGTTWQQFTRIYAQGDENAQDLTFARLKGKGVYVGDAVTVYNPNLGWWGEGDEKVYVDGETFPSHFGTGTEDYYGYAWGRYEPWINHPFIAQPIGDGCYGHIGLAQNTRVRSLDAIPFTRSLQFDMELFDWSNVYLNYAPITFWYMMPGGEKSPEPLVSDVREPVAYRPADIFGTGMSLVVEGEAMLPVSGYAGTVELQSILRDLWSEGMQLYWRDFQPGDRLVLIFDSQVDGFYDVKALLTLAPDYGTFRFRLNGQDLEPAIELTDGEITTRPYNLGKVRLVKGRNELVVESVSLAPGHDRGFFGLDKMTFRP